MPILTIHLPHDLDPETCQALAQQARQAIYQSLNLHPRFGHVILYPSPPHCRAAAPQRDPRFVVAELTLFQGRPPEVKERLLARLAQLIQQHTGTHPDDIFVVLNEIPRANLGIRGGVPASRVDLGH
jgi:phenylpyruvate tautomerase PptA (4-oxalocrotonate tautomerase family)